MRDGEAAGEVPDAFLCHEKLLTGQLQNRPQIKHRRCRQQKKKHLHQAQQMPTLRHRLLHRQLGRGSSRLRHHQSKRNMMSGRNAMTTIAKRKQTETCNECDEPGHWAGDKECQKPGQKLDFTPRH